ncbi:putative metalloprotease CJM1_0395 family protein [Agarivorans sp. 1_MG-2023]|uniref:putative metalloprotease CJM1_0395 family protein n=1 Tax=Agarivorans sp. 1_MG-2023 TaxID=3062634 RepID=UPI0026E27DFF|nr:putative metalloprotease CJM1_0395 family protein [Agarivorans sp. 1_MG-2023]MDO6763475.1 putative metalloprotease CJM1_0395 family protein [Agarivorans sp. 1_MG-2023]
MNINVSLPNVFPNTLSPPTDAARRDNQLRQVIAQPKEVASFAKEPEVGAEKDRSKPQVTAQYPQVQEQQNAKISERETQQGREQQGDQQGKQGDQAKDGEQAGSGQSGSEQPSARQKSQNELSEGEQKKVDELSSRDREVRTHEAQHQAVGGQYASAASFELERGPDGKQYAVGGEVSIDVSEIPDDPQATIAKMEQVQRAALAPAEPSSQDRQVAAQAQQKAAEAQQELNHSQPPGLLASDEQPSAFETGLNATEEEQQSAQAQQQQNAQALQQRYPDIAQQMAQRNDHIQQRYASAAAFRPQSQLSLQA